MVEKIIRFSVKNKFIVLLFTFSIVFGGIYSLMHLPVGAVPDITNNQVQVITTTRNLSTEDVEQLITYPVELEMSNLPGIKEIRSVSKFGLSVVTLVFEDKMGTYLPRQLIAEKLRSVAEKLPEGIDKPQAGPITTGLGEIYQYTLEVDPKYKDKYSLTDLRTIQDWIVKRYLSGIPGVVEVNTWGGFLKQYEIRIDPATLTALNLTVNDVYNALKANNGIAGGGYIEKHDKSYFIRSDGLARNLDDIRNIVVTVRNGIPVYIKDIGKVGFGHATRFGAVTANGEGEKVMGQILMLKGANVSEVIGKVKKRIEAIKKTLPEGIYINPVLERTELLDKTTFTIAENLIFGSLIVTFMVLLLLGNWRSAFIISSVIPLSLLFALSMMYIFGIDANLMSLGAIDFGIIIDGAVIIVEFIAFRMALDYIKTKAATQAEIDDLTVKSASKMMHSAIFGQLIIIIVFFPILALTGIEGKMFRPMALVFIFALTGVMILGMTYLPVMSSLLLKPDMKKFKVSDKIIAFLNKLYAPSLRYALHHKKLVIVTALGIFITSLYVFSKLGGEFVPTLDEGDFVIQPVLKTGTSLRKAIETSTKIEKILKKFPEVDQVVSRIGAAEVPTDPMSMEDMDIIVKLRPKDEWKTAGTKEELIRIIKDSLRVLPGIEYEFTQPIEMRFNELISGTRSDVAVKIYGEDLYVLNNLANKIKKEIEKIPGAADITVEKVAGLPQMLFKIRREKLAKYGLSVEDVNSLIRIAFGGLPAGEIFEGEKRFGLVARLPENVRSNIRKIQAIPVSTATGHTIPLAEVVDITLKKGPAKISRDATHRRISIGVNVRGRDMESVVEDIQKTIDKKIKLPPGYNIRYGGQFENLRSAKKRLMIVVPFALFLIFLMLYFAFKSVKISLLIFSAVPLSAIGGIFALWIRGMPFSISAGVGFIALFGIAVLNGIVLIEHFNELILKGRKMYHIIIKGAQDRMRPVILTASAAMMGFLPMAVSQSAGAEVQRPLATVVIGGLFTSTLLTLIVLPVLYAIYGRNKDKGNTRLNLKQTIMILILTIPGFKVTAQVQKDTVLENLYALALKHNQTYQASLLEIEKNKVLRATAWELDKTEFSADPDPTNIDPLTGKPFYVISAQQSFKFPTYYFQKRKLLSTRRMLSIWNSKKIQRQLFLSIGTAYEHLLYESAKERYYRHLYELYEKFKQAAEKKFRAGESTALEFWTAKSKLKEIELTLKDIQRRIERYKSQLSALVQAKDLDLEPDPDLFVKLSVSYKDEEVSKTLMAFGTELKEEEKKLDWKTEKAGLWPGFHIAPQVWTSPGNPGISYSALSFGISIPLFFGGKSAKIRAKKIAYEQQILLSEDTQIRWRNRLNQLYTRLEQQKERLNYYENEGKIFEEKIGKAAGESFKTGEIDYFRYVISVENATKIRLKYLEDLLQYNLTVLKIKYIIP